MLIIALFLLQIGRRNLTKSQLVKAYSRVETQLAEEAKVRKEANLKQNSDGVKFDPSEKGRTAETVAKKIGVSKNTYKAMKQIVSEGTKEQIERMDKGGKGTLMYCSLATFILSLDKKHMKQQLVIGRKILAK